MSKPPILCIGGCVTDRYGETHDEKERLYTSNIGALRMSVGGVARNVSENLARLGVPAMLASRVGDDADGHDIIARTRATGVDVSPVILSAGERTATYTAIFSGAGELVIGLADMAIFDSITPEQARNWINDLPPGGMIFADANLGSETLATIAAMRGDRFLAIGPVSQQKILRLAGCLDRIDLLFLNRFEAQALTGAATDDLGTLADAVRALGLRNGLLSNGPGDALIWDDGGLATIAALPAKVVNVNGAGDSLAAGTLAQMWHGASLAQAARFGMACAALTVTSPFTVMPDLTAKLVSDRLPAAPETQ